MSLGWRSPPFFPMGCSNKGHRSPRDRAWGGTCVNIVDVTLEPLSDQCGCRWFRGVVYGSSSVCVQGSFLRDPGSGVRRIPKGVGRLLSEWSWFAFLFRSVCFVQGCPGSGSVYCFRLLFFVSFLFWSESVEVNLN